MSGLSDGHKRKREMADAVSKGEFNSDEETQIFGKRRIVEIRGGVFECVTLSSFDIEDEVSSLRKISSVAGPERTVIAINNELSLLSFAEDKDHDVLNFEAKVDCVCCTPDGTYVAAGLEDGFVLIYNIDEKDVLIKKKCADAETSGNTFSSLCSIETSDSNEVIAVTTAGKIVKFCISSEKPVEVIETYLNEKTNILDSAIVYSMFGLPNLAVGGNNNVAIYSLEDFSLQANFPLLGQNLHVKSLCFCPNISLLLALFDNGCAMMLCPDTLVCFTVLDTAGLIEQLSLITSTEDNSEQLLVLSKLGDQHSISILETDGFREVVSFDVCEKVHLVEHFGRSNDVMFLEKDYRDGNDKKLLLRTMSKSQPEFRLQRLLRQQKYSEAIAFATRYQLDTQQVYKSEVTYYINRNTQIDSETSIKLKEALSKVNDCEFVADSCQKATMPSMPEMIALLKYGQERVCQALPTLENAASANVLALQEKLYFAKQKLETFGLLSVSSSETDWLEFYREDLLMELIPFLNEGNVGNACILWRRHETQFMEILTAENIPSLLDVIPMNTDPKIVITWFSLFIPSVLKHVPETFGEIATTVLKKIMQYSTVPTKKWPNEALEFCVKSIHILQPEDLNELNGWLMEWQNQDSSSKTPLKELQALHKSLSDLVMIRTKLDVQLSLDEYNQLSNIDGLHNLLKKVKSRKLIDFVNNFSCFALPDSDLDCEGVIASYIEHEVHTCRSSFESSRTEERIFILFDHLTTPEKISHCVSKILRSASIPWSKEMGEFASRMEKSSDAIAHVVKAQRRLAKVKKLLIKYELMNMLNVGEACLDVNYISRAIFHHQLPDMLEDALVIASTKPGLEVEAHTLYVVYLLNKFEMKNATSYVKILKQEVQVELAERLLCKAEANIHYDEIGMVVEISGFLQLLENLLKSYPRTKQTLDPDFSHRVKFVADTVKTYSKHPAQLNLDPKVENLDSDVILEEEPQEDNLSKVTNMISYNGDMLSSIEVTLKLASSIWSENNIDLLRQLLTEKLHDSAWSQNEIDLLLELAKHTSDKSPALISLLKSALGGALLRCPIDRITDVLAASKCVEEMFDLLSRKGSIVSLQEFSAGEMVSSKDPFKSWSFSPLYDDMPMNIMYSAETLHILHQTNPAEQIDDHEANERFLLNLNAMQIENCDLLLLCLICRFLSENKLSRSLIKSLKEKKSAVIQSLLNKILLEKKADLFLALSLLQNFTYEEAVEYLESYITKVRNDCSYLFRMSQLSIDYSLISKYTKNIPQLVKLLHLASWGKRVKKLSLNPRSIMSHHQEDKGHILQQMMLSNPSQNVDLMFEFCKEFNLNVNIEIIALMQTLILNWKPEVKYESTENDTESLVIVKNTKVEKRIYTLFEKIANNYYGPLEIKLDNIWDKLNVYHYEMYEVMLKIKSMINPEFESVQSHVLLFLESYRRINPPQGAEVEKWMRNHCEGTPLPELAKIRLPFPSFVQEIGNIIKAEVNLKNYEIWLNAPAVLKLDPGEICSAAVANAVGTELHLSNLEQWNFKTKENFVNDISDCIEYLQDLPGAAAILDYASKRVPLSQDRISLIVMCHQKLIQAVEEDIPIDKQLLAKVAGKLVLYSVVHQLHENGLARKEYLDLAEDPEKLIDALYKDASIIERIKGGVGNYPDIHAVVGNICHITDLEVDKIRSQILGTLLFPDSGSCDSLDESFIDVSMSWQQMNKKDMMSLNEINVNLLKAQYMLEAGTKQAHVDHIFSICNNPNVSVTNTVRLRAWRLMLWLLPIEEICINTDMDKTAILEKMAVLYFLSELEAVQGHSGTEEQFKTTDKVSVIEGLWRNQSSNPRALVLMTKICLHYNIKALVAWSNIISKMIHLKMQTDLEMLMPKLNRHICLFELPVFATAWSHVISAPFAKADNPMNEEQYEVCKKSLMLMQNCPILSKIEFSLIFEMCLKKERLDLAALILPYISINIELHCQDLLNKIKINDLKKKLIELDIATPGLPVVQALKVVEDSVHQNGQ